VHSHADLEVLEHRTEKVMQGVTTEVVGNCGFSVFPKVPLTGLAPVFDILFARRDSREWEDAGSYFEDVEGTKTRTNVAALTGHSSLRAGVTGMKAGSLAGDDLREVEKRLTACLEQGSIGMSTGLNEVPSSYGDFEELVGLCRIVHQHGGLYTSHLRDYKFRFVEAVQEALDLGRGSGVPVQLSHLQAVGRKNWDKMDPVLEMIDQAVAEGVDVGIDAYPYVAGSCNMTQLLPLWCMEGGKEELMSRLREPESRRQIAAETDGYMSNGWEDIMLANLANSDQQDLVGNRVQDVADERGCAGVEAALDLLIENECGIMIISFNQSDENLRKVLTHPLTSIITDGLMTEGKPHPRTFGTYPTFLGEYVRDKGWMSLEAAVRKVSALPAARFGLEGRGLLQPGNCADVIVFSADEIGTRGDYNEPNHAPDGIEHVLINGAWALRERRLDSQGLSGQPLRV
jgi:dihydroorotase/N-acyl-D-amino-acid deacylase